MINFSNSFSTYRFLIILFFIFFTNASVFAQSGMRFLEFSKRLEMYFHPDLVADIQKEMPKNDFAVWGWDVGDFSGDGNNDVAFSIRRSGLKSKAIDIYLFVDIDGYLTKVGQTQCDYFELPLEVGVAIRNGICYITQKFKQYNWDINSYKFINGSLINYDTFSTRRFGKNTRETYKNYYELHNTEKYLTTSNGKPFFVADYLVIPSYSRGRLIYKGYSHEAYANRIEYVPEGAYWLNGEQDLSFYTSSAYDAQNLYISVTVVDDYVVTPFCDTCPSESIEVWLDVNNYSSENNRFATVKDDIPLFNNKAKTGLYKFEIRAGDFINKPATVVMSSSDALTNIQKIAATDINVVCDLTDNGYYMLLKIPFSAVSATAPPIHNNNTIIEWGCTVKVIDYDNEFRPEQKTVMTTSVFSESNPASYGSLIFMPDNMWYGETHNIMQNKIVECLERFGF